MNILKRFFGIPYKLFVLLRERFFQVPAPEVPPLHLVEGTGGLESSQIFSESVTSTTTIDEEVCKLVPVPEVPPLHLVEDTGGLESSQIFSESVAPTTTIDEEGCKIEEKELFGKEMGDREIPPVFENQRISLCETLDRVLNTGVVVHGDITISVANIDLIYISLRTLITSVETARQLQEKP